MDRKPSSIRALCPLWGPLPKEAFGAEDEDEDEDAEDDRLRPLAARCRPVEAVVERLDHRDHHCSENSPGQVADPSEHRSRERDQADPEPFVVTNVREVERVEEPRGARKAARDEER